MIDRLRIIEFIIFAILFSVAQPAIAADSETLPLVTDVDLQPLAAQVKRVDQALDLVGSPLDKAQREALDWACSATDPAVGVRGIQEVLDPLCLAMVEINAESRVKVAVGPAPKRLIQQGWRVFLVKVKNDPSVGSALRVSSPNAAPLQVPSSGSSEPKPAITSSDVTNRWLDIGLADSQPLNKTLSGLKLEYRIVELYSRDAGRREAKLEFDVGQGTQDLGFRNEINVLFDCEPAVAVKLGVLDDDGAPTTARFTIRDEQGRIYPSRARRLAPDFFFHDQIYRHDGEMISLPPGKYHVAYTRGPEYRVLTREITVAQHPHPQPLSRQGRGETAAGAASDTSVPAQTQEENFRLERWIKLADHGWYSGDHHIHAAGCSHYESPTAGVTPQDMMRHIEGEDLDVGCVLSWGPCWYVQKQYFDGHVSKLSTPHNLMRYDVEVSGFPSSHAGHVCLLRLAEQDYPGTTRIEEWPSWDLPVLQWGKRQGAVVGFAHSGWGLKTNATKLPAFEMPPFDGIGANEYIVDVAHDAVDFISTVDTPALWELPIWYHTLNCGFTTRISGETDFPCIYGDRVGLGRSYVKLPKDQPLDYDAWVAGIRAGRSYVSDGLSHLFDFSVNGLGVGESGAGRRPSVLASKAGEKLTVKVRAAALLADKPRDDIRRLPLDQKPYWHTERARIGDTRQVPVELIVNGQSVERKLIEADGQIQDLTFDYTPRVSSWLAVRIFPAAHTNPIFVELDNKPIRASRRSAQWCLTTVEVCWKAKSPQIRPTEIEAAKAAYAKARKVYQARVAEAVNDESPIMPIEVGGESYSNSRLISGVIPLDFIESNFTSQAAGGDIDERRPLVLASEHSRMGSDLLAFRTALKHVSNYNRESADLSAAHHEAMDCRDCEAFLQLGIDAFEWIIRADRVIRRAIFAGRTEFDPEIERKISLLCDEWLSPCAYAEQWIAKQQELGFQIDNLDEFRECCEEMSAIVEARNQGEGESLPVAISALRDEAIREHLNGETSEFI